MPITITGRVVYQSGPWGSKRPLRNVGSVTVWMMSSTQPMLFGTAVTNQNGWFIITANLPPAAVLDMYVQVDDLCGVDTYMHHILRKPIPNSSILFPDHVGDIAVPWEPVDAKLADLDIFFIKDTQTLAKRLCERLKSPYYPLHISLWRESADGTGNDYTPAQKLLIPLKAPKSGFLPRLVQDIQDEIVSTKSNTTNDALIEILERLSLVSLKVLETGSLLNRLLAAIQRSVITHSYSEKLAVDPAHDMAAACVLLFLAGLIHKDNVQPTIMFRSSSWSCRGNAKHVISKILIDVSKN